MTLGGLLLFYVEVVFSLRPPGSMVLGRRDVEGAPQSAGLRASSRSRSPRLPSSSCSSSPLLVASDPPLPGDRLLPSLPPLLFKNDEVAPKSADEAAFADVPIQCYRRQRLRRALGVLPRGLLLPPPLYPTALPPSPCIGTTGQYAGDFTVTVWNSQALFAADPVRHHVKTCYVSKLMATSDILLISEAHGTDTGNASWRGPPRTTSWWSCGSTTGHAGVGIVLKNEFLANFLPNPRFDVIWPGRAACLRLRSNRGSLDIWVVYFPTGKEVGPHELHGVRPDLHDRLRTFPALRAHLRSRLADQFASANEVLSIVGGDFDYVTTEDERVSLGTATASGRKDCQEEAHFQQVLGRPFGLHDMYQPESTHASSSSRSRLDRIYVNYHVIDQLDRHIRCAPREWRPDLSAHRAVTFCRAAPAPKSGMDKPLTLNSIHHEDFQRRVSLAFSEKLRQHAEIHSFAKVSLLKDAMKEVGRNLEHSAAIPPPAIQLEDRLGVTMKLIRAIENGFLSDISACLERYPKVSEHISNPYDTTGNLTAKLRNLKDHAVSLARDHALDELNKSHEDLASGSTFAAHRARQRNNRLIFRIAPGRSGSFGAIQDSRGRVHTDTEGMADALRRHWSQIFTAGGIDRDQLRQWIAEDIGLRQGNRFSRGSGGRTSGRQLTAPATQPRDPMAFPSRHGESARTSLLVRSSMLSSRCVPMTPSACWTNIGRTSMAAFCSSCRKSSRVSQRRAAASANWTTCGP